VTAAAARLEERCAGVRAVAVDCDEFPCAVSVAQSADAPPCDLAALAPRSKVRMRVGDDEVVTTFRVLPAAWDGAERAVIDARWDYREHVVAGLARSEP
jgi:hypothetical protein